MKNPAPRSSGSRAGFGFSKSDSVYTGANISDVAAVSQFHHLQFPIVVDRFCRNRRGEAAVTSIRKYNERLLVDCRVHYTDPEGKLQPGQKGLAVAMARLPDLARAINKCHVKALQLGLLGNSHLTPVSS